MTRDEFREAVAVQAAAWVHAGHGALAVELLSFAAMTELVLDQVRGTTTKAHEHAWVETTPMGGHERTFTCRLCSQTRTEPWGTVEEGRS